jgi:hypothetical protein
MVMRGEEVQRLDEDEEAIFDARDSSTLLYFPRLGW